MINHSVILLALLAACTPSQDRTAPPAAARSIPSPSPAPADDTIVASSDFREPITYRRIRCGARFAVDAEKCHALEQSNLQTRLYQLAIDAAAAAHRVELSPGERAEVEQRVLAEHAENVDAARKFRAAIEGAARVRAGELLDTVAADLARADIPKMLIEQSVNEYRTEAEARRALTRDFVAESDAAVRTYMTREKVSAKLRELISARARASGISEDEAADAFWKEIVARYRIRVVDPRYQAPDFKGALNIHETTLATSP